MRFAIFSIFNRLRICNCKKYMSNFFLKFVKDLYDHKVMRRFFEKMITVISYTVSKSQFSIFQKPTFLKPKRLPLKIFWHIIVVILCKTKWRRPKFKKSFRSRNKKNLVFLVPFISIATYFFQKKLYGKHSIHYETNDSLIKIQKFW